MSPSLFRGRFEFSIDPKGRLSIPAKFRQIIEQRHEGKVFVANLPKCLVAYTPEEWEAVEARASRLPAFNPKVQAYQRLFISSAVECGVDGQGRILVPPSLRSQAALERQVVIAGLLDRFEIWSRQRWDEEMAEAMKNFDQISEDLAGLGI